MSCVESIRYAVKKKKSGKVFDLAARYTIDTEGDARKRLMFKKKLTELALAKGLSVDKTEQLLSFVFDYMLLPDEMENEYIATTPFMSSQNSNKMVQTRGEKMFADSYLAKLLYEKEAILADISKIKAENAKIKAENAKLLAEKEAEKEAMRQKNNIKLFKPKCLVEKIAEMMELDLEYVSKIVNNKLSTESK